MEFQLMVRGRGYIGAAGRGQTYRASDTASSTYSQKIYYFAEPQGLLAAMFQRGKGIHAGYIEPAAFGELRDMSVLMVSKRQLENFGMGNYALFRVA